MCQSLLEGHGSRGGRSGHGSVIFFLGQCVLVTVLGPLCTLYNYLHFSDGSTKVQCSSNPIKVTQEVAEAENIVHPHLLVP